MGNMCQEPIQNYTPVPAVETPAPAPATPEADQVGNAEMQRRARAASGDDSLDMAHDGADWIARAGLLSRLLPGAGGHVANAGLFGPAGVLAGGMSIAEGADNPDVEEGALEVTDGVAQTVGGACRMAGPAGASCALATTAFRGGLAVGHYGDERVEDLGWLEDEDGDAESASDRLARHAHNTRMDVEEFTGSSVAGHIAGGLDFLLELPAATATAVFAALSGHSFEGGSTNVPVPPSAGSAQVRGDDPRHRHRPQDGGLGYDELPNGRLVAH